MVDGASLSPTILGAIRQLDSAGGGVPAKRLRPHVVDDRGPAYHALGIFGQTVHINPELDLVIVTQSAWPTALSGVELEPPFIKAVEAAVQD